MVRGLGGVDLSRSPRQRDSAFASGALRSAARVELFFSSHCPFTVSMRKMIYGMRTAAQCWKDHHSERSEKEGSLVDLQLRRCSTTQSLESGGVVHSNDLTFSGTLNEVGERMETMVHRQTQRLYGQRTGRNPRDRDLGSNNMLG